MSNTPSPRRTACPTRCSRTALARSWRRPLKSFQAAAANADWAGAPGYSLILTDQPGAGSWPITGATFVLVPAQATKPAAARHVLSFFDWAYAKGDAMAEALHYVPLPDSVVRLIHETWQAVVDPAGRPVRATPAM